jgi:hypothetical protein
MVDESSSRVERNPSTNGVTDGIHKGMEMCGNEDRR